MPRNMPFKGSSKLGDEYNPERWKTQESSTGQLGSFVVEESESTGVKSQFDEGMLNKIEAQLKSGQFQKLYGTKATEDAYDIMVSSGRATEYFNKQGVRTGVRFLSGKTITDADLPRASGMQFQKMVEYGEPGSSEQRVFFEGEQNQMTRSLENEIEDLKGLVTEMETSGTYDKPITELNARDAAKAARINKARARVGLDPIVKPQPITNFDIKEKTVGEYYMNELLRKQVQLDTQKDLMGKSEKTLFNESIIKKASPEATEFEVKSFSEPVDTPRASTENPTAGVRRAEDVVRGVVNRTTFNPDKPSTALSAYRGKEFKLQSKAVQDKILKNASFKKLVNTYTQDYIKLGETKGAAEILAKNKAINDVDSILLGSDDSGWNLSKVKGFNTRATIKNLVEDLAKAGTVETRPGTLDTGGIREFSYDLGGIADQSSSSRSADIVTTGVEPEGYSNLRRTETLPGETIQQARKRNSILAQISGWNPKENTWFKNSDVAAYETKQKTLRTLVTSGQVNPMDIAWDTMKRDFNTGSFNPDDIGRYIKPSAATDTTVSALKQVVGKSTSRVKPSKVKLPKVDNPLEGYDGPPYDAQTMDRDVPIYDDPSKVQEPKELQPEGMDERIPEVKRAADVAPSTVNYQGPDINIAGLTDSQIQKIPAYKDALDALADVDMDDAAKVKYATQRTRDALKQLDLQDANAKKGFQRMLKAILKGL